MYFPPAPAAPHAVHLVSFNTLAELVPPRESWTQFFTGGAISPFVGSPAGLAYRDGRLYVCDTSIEAVQVWDLTTGKSRRLGTGDAGSLIKPVDVAVDDGGTVYVADTGRSEVVAFGDNGPTGQTFKPPDSKAYRPVAVAVRGGDLLVADVAAHRVDVYSIASGKHTGGFGGAGSEPGRFAFPTGLAVDAAGNTLVADMFNARVQVVDAKRSLVRSFGQPGNRYGDMGKPRRVAVGPDDTIFVADSEFAHVHLFNSQGELLMLLGGEADEAGHTPMPVAVAVAPDLPPRLAELVPADFRADYYLFVANAVGTRRIGLFAIGTAR